jgi:hypothetical protein
MVVRRQCRWSMAPRPHRLTRASRRRPDRRRCASRCRGRMTSSDGPGVRSMGGGGPFRQTAPGVACGPSRLPLPRLQRRWCDRWLLLGAPAPEQQHVGSVQAADRRRAHRVHERHPCGLFDALPHRHGRRPDPRRAPRRRAGARACTDAPGVRGLAQAARCDTSRGNPCSGSWPLDRGALRRPLS